MSEQKTEKSVAETVTVKPADAKAAAAEPPKVVDAAAVKKAREKKLMAFGAKTFAVGPVDVKALGFGNVFELIAKLRDLARVFQNGPPTRDQLAGAAKVLLGLLGLEAEGAELELFVGQLGDINAAARDLNGSEIRLRRLLADRFLTPAGGFTVQAADGEPELPLHAALARVASELEAHATGTFTRDEAGVRSVSDDLAEIDPTALPPIVWKIGGQLLLRLITRLIGF